MGNWLEDLTTGAGNSIIGAFQGVTGVTKSNQITAAQQQQAQFEQAYLAQQQAEAQLQYNPALAAQRTKQVLYVVVGLVVLVILLKVFKVF